VSCDLGVVSYCTLYFVPLYDTRDNRKGYSHDDISFYSLIGRLVGVVRRALAVEMKV
jgi:hypothetical protein